MLKMSEERRAYLEEVAEDYGVDLFTVMALAAVLGEEEDYDGLIEVIGGM